MSLESLKVQIIKKAWAEPAFKESLLADPKQAIQAAFGVEIPAAIDLKVVVESSSLYYLTIPPNPEDQGGAGSSTNTVWN
ncbi:NHLP leader peptide family RiPP precursor [Cohnella faecalis]|uniref:NHLP leader peptide family natural product n=1 Tax=Cohnella faecalis TaxID=2315694 RepID=A0A398CH69_9BACL|nr:NHLP leader peptide family RiPP precursor [Cohnella faecalis]RIE01815.1 NHLP leader peptide family natural product precursor [Cohnella faecalis]